VLVDTSADARWARENAPRVLSQRGYSPAKVELVRRWFNGEFESREYLPIFWRISGAYMPNHGWRGMLRELAEGGWRSRIRPEPFQFAGRSLLPGWSVTTRLGEITVPTLVIAGREDFIFPPECQRELVSGIAHAELAVIDEAGHNPQDENPAEVMEVLRPFLAPPDIPSRTGEDEKLPASSNRPAPAPQDHQ
jgi:proline iminopeptidase